MPNTSRNHRSNGRQRETTGDRRETDGRRTGDDPSKRPRTDLKTWENASQAKLKFSFFEKKMLGKSEQKIYFLRFFCLPLVFQWVSSVSRCCLPLLSPVVSRCLPWCRRRREHRDLPMDPQRGAQCRKNIFAHIAPMGPPTPIVGVKSTFLPMNRSTLRYLTSNFIKSTLSFVSKWHFERHSMRLVIYGGAILCHSGHGIFPYNSHFPPAPRTPKVNVGPRRGLSDALPTHPNIELGGGGSRIHCRCTVKCMSVYSSPINDKAHYCASQSAILGRNSR